MPNLPMSSQHAAEARFAGNIEALVSQHRNDSRRRNFRKARLIGDLQDPLALLFAQSMAGRASQRLRSSISAPQPFTVPALERTNIDSSQSARRLEPGAIASCLGDPRYDFLAIFHEGHSSSSLR
jgi:hypothetical protein